MTTGHLLYRIGNVEVAVAKVRYKGDPGEVVEFFARSATTFQLIPVKISPSPRHIAIAAYKAYRAFERGYAISKSPGIEVLLYLIGSRQISEALSLLKSAGSTNTYHLVVCGRDAARIVNKAIKRFHMEMIPIDEGQIQDCILCSRIGEEELSSYLGSPGERVEKAAITRTSLLVTIL